MVKVLDILHLYYYIIYNFNLVLKIQYQCSMASSNRYFQIPSPLIYLRLCNFDDFQSVNIALKGYNEAEHLSCFRLVGRKEVFIHKVFFSVFPFLQRIRILI